MRVNSISVVLIDARILFKGFVRSVVLPPVRPTFHPPTHGTHAHLSQAPHKWRRDLAALEKWEAVNHNRTGILDNSPATPDSIIFGANTSSILSPTITDGPYYVWGEVVRQNVNEELYSDGVDV